MSFRIDMTMFMIASLALKSGHFWRVASSFLIMTNICVVYTAGSERGVEFAFTMVE